MELKELYTKVMASEALKASFTEAAKDKEKLSAWLKEQGVSASVDEVGKFLKEHLSASGEVTDDELENVAGGSKTSHVFGSILESVVGVGVACAVELVKSGNVDKIGQDYKICGA